MCAYFEWEKYAQKMGFKNPYRERQERCRLKEVQVNGYRCWKMDTIGPPVPQERIDLWNLVEENWIKGWLKVYEENIEI